MTRLNMLSPWMVYYHQVVAFFEKDNEINVVWDDSGETDVLKIYVNNPAKAEALSQLLPNEKNFGVVTVGIDIIPSNTVTAFQTSINFKNVEDVLQTAFKGNESLDFIKTVEGLFSNPITYVVFKKEVIQYFNDSLGDAFGQCSTLSEMIARDIFIEREGIFYCTNKNVPFTISAGKFITGYQ